MDYRIAIASQLPGLIKNIRKQRGITQAELGMKLGISQRAVAQFEAHPEKASFHRVLSVLSALDIDLVLKERKQTASEQRIEGDTW